MVLYAGDIIGHTWLYIHEAEWHLADYDSFVCLPYSVPSLYSCLLQKSDSPS